MIHYTIKPLGLLTKFAFVSLAAVAIEETFRGQLIIALIAALPPTGAVVVALIALMRGQEKMHKSLDGKLSELVQAKGEVAHAQGVQQERSEERERQEVAVKIPAQIEIINTDDNPVPVKPGKEGLK